MNNMEIVRIKNIPKGIWYIYVSDSKTMVLNSIKSLKINEKFKLMIQIEPHCNYNMDSYFMEKSNEIIGLTQSIESNPFYYTNNEILMTKILNDRYKELVDSAKKQNSIIYIGDSFTKFNLENYFNVIDLAYSDMFLLQKLLTEHIFSNHIEFIFIESGWLGKDNSWRKILNNDSNELKRLKEIAVANQMKIVFMNKEDPYYFDKFTNVAKISDFIITTDESCIPKYKEISDASIIAQTYFIDNIKYNPFYKKNISKAIYFAGAYYEKYEERTAFFEKITPILGVDIFDRNSNNSSINKMPKTLEKYVVGGSLSQEELIGRSLEYKFALNLNSLIDEETMVARRVFENIALGMPQVSNYSRGISKLTNYEIIMNETNNISEISNVVEGYQYNTQKLQKDALEVLRKLSTYKLVETLNKYEICNISLPHDLCFEIYVDTESELLSNILSNSKFKLKTNIMFNFIIDESLILDDEIYKKIMHHNSSITINAKTGMIPKIKMVKNINLPIDLIDDIYIATKSEYLSDKNIEFEISDKTLTLERVSSNGIEKIHLEYDMKSFDRVIPIISTVYPSYSNIYQNGFIYSRVKDYTSSNTFAPFFKITNNFNNYEFEDTNCFEVDSEMLVKILKIIDCTHIEVHFLETKMKNIIHAVDKEFIIFIHGYEAQNFQKRRPFLIEEKDIEMDKLRTASKQKIFSDVITYENVSLSFASNWQVEVFNEDINIMELPYKYSVIPNSIDVKQFKYVEKDFSKLKILSLRPFASAVYANDITIGAILKLSEKEYFEKIEFTICGAGPLYEKQIDELRSKEFSNVKLINKFFTHGEIKKLHDENNIFVCPSRADTQGVSRCEAMSSGLVTIGTKVGGVPEFNSEDTGYLMKENSIDELCAVIESMYWDRRSLPKLSSNGSKFITEKCSYDIRQLKYAKYKYDGKVDTFRYKNKDHNSIKIRNYDSKEPIITNKDCNFSIYCFDNTFKFVEFNKKGYAKFADIRNRRTFPVPKDTEIYFNKGANVAIVANVENFNEEEFLDLYLKGEDLVSSNDEVFDNLSDGIREDKRFDLYGEYYASKNLKNGVYISSNNDRLFEITEYYAKKISISNPCYILINGKEDHVESIIISHELLERNNLDVFSNTSEILSIKNVTNQAINIKLEEE